jgi:hypothetical protein
MTMQECYLQVHSDDNVAKKDYGVDFPFILDNLATRKKMR